ncbi:TPA: hypothetical protein H1008_02380 [archaeon]|nr:hypothetical protein [Candidatus Undinarchaeales archaeon SRR5007147.bin71]
MVSFDALPVFSAFVLSIALTYIFIRRFKRIGRTAEDIHKEGRPMQANFGGISVAAALGTILLGMYLVTSSAIYMTLTLVFLISASVGLLDDLFRFNPYQKLALSAIPALPLILFWGFGVYQVLAVVAAIVVLSNWTNMLAGFNGLEAGMGAIALFFLGLNTWNFEVRTALFAYSLALLGFLMFNRYPAKVFPGDVGTLPIGAFLAASVALGAPLIDLAILSIPYFLDMILKLTTMGVASSKNIVPTRVENGILVPQKSYLSLTNLILRIKRMREWQLVTIYWLVEIALGMVTLVI